MNKQIKIKSNRRHKKKGREGWGQKFLTALRILLDGLVVASISKVNIIYVIYKVAYNYFYTSTFSEKHKYSTVNVMKRSLVNSCIANLSWWCLTHTHSHTHTYIYNYIYMNMDVCIWIYVYRHMYIDIEQRNYTKWWSHWIWTTSSISLSGWRNDQHDL